MDKNKKRGEEREGKEREREREEMRLKINIGKTKIMRIWDKGTLGIIKILGSINGSAGEQQKIHKANRTFDWYKKFLKSKESSNRTKLKIHNVIIRLMMMYAYAAETMT